MNEEERRWQVILTRQAEKTLYRLPKPLLQQIDHALLALAEKPCPPESHRLASYNDLYRLPIEEWRLTYAIAQERLTILILEITPKQQPGRYRLEEEPEESLSTPYEGTSTDPTGAPLAHPEKIRGECQYDVYRTELGDLLRQARQKRIRLLIVDDLVETRENLRKLLYFESDIRVVGAATNGEEAVQLAVELNPDVILMDMILPGLDGIRATEIISQQVPTAQVIMMSVHGETDYLRRAMLAGAKEFLIKPFSSDELMTSIRRVYR